MSNLKIYNDYVLNEYLKLSNKNILSYPLLVSSNNFLNKEDKILYIGQETNTWLQNYTDVTEELLSEKYEELLLNKPNTTFWKFLDKINFENNDVIWANTLICGNKNKKGTTINYQDIKNISLEYLIFIYEYFKPYKTIFVCGPRNPYCDIVKQFLKNYNIYLDSPSKYNLISSSKNIYWTYHPNFLRYGNELEAIDKIKHKM